MITVFKTICNEMNEHFVKIGKQLGVQITNTNNKICINFPGKRQISSVCL